MTEADAAYPGGITSSDKPSSGLGRRPDRVRSDLGIARSRPQIVMTEQNLNDPDIGSAFQQVRRETMAQGVQRDSLGQTGGFDRRSAGGVQHRRIKRMIVIPTGKQEGCRPRQPPVGAKNAKQLRRRITLRSLPPWPCRTRITPHALSMSATRSPATSEALSPAAQAVVSAARLFRLDTDSKNRTTSSALNRLAVYAGRAHRRYARERPPRRA
jgi:hypothetical protein